MHLGFRADGGASIGYGHLVRTGALVERFRDDGCEVTYATRTPGPVEATCPDGVGVVELGDDHYGEFLAWLSAAEPDIAVVDSYDVRIEFLQKAAERVPLLSVFMDDAPFAVRADVLINGNVYAPELEYDCLGPEPEWCLGTEYLPLREEIRMLARETPSFNESPVRALITMGGSDIQGTTPQAIRAFDGLDVTVDVVVGPGFENRDAIADAVADTDASFDVVEDPGDLAERMFRADIAVSATGSTVYELLALGTPTVGLPQADNQEPIARSLRERDAIVTVDPDDRPALAESVRSLIDDATRRATLQDRGTGLVDGGGVERIHGTLLEASP